MAAGARRALTGREFRDVSGQIGRMRVRHDGSCVGGRILSSVYVRWGIDESSQS